MPINSKKSIFSTILIIVFLTFHIAVAGNEKFELTGELSQDQSTLAPTAPFESLPPEIVKKILQELSQEDLKKIRLVNKKFKKIAACYIQSIIIPTRFSDKEFQWFQNFVADLRNVNVTFLQKPSDAVFEQFRNVLVNTLKLKSINAQDIQELALHLPSYFRGLNLDWNSIGVEAIQTLLTYLPSTLQRLSLNGNNVGVEAIQTLAPRLPSTLQQLNLSQNSIGVAGTQVLASHLPPTLQQLSLNGNSIEIAGIQALAPHLPPTLQQLDLSWNDIEEAGLTTLLNAIPKTDLAHLSISVPAKSPLRGRLQTLRNRQGHSITVTFW
ncbi:MAG: F-box protein [Alphaproteobacteria bacterium]